MRAVVLLAVIALAGAASAEPHKHRHKRAHHATAHKRTRSPRVAPLEPSPSGSPLEPQLQISQPHAAVERVAEAREAPPPPPQEAPPPAQLEQPAPPPAPPPPSVARLDLTVHVVEAPPPAVLPGVPAPSVTERPADLHRKRRWGMFGGGLAMFLIGYGADIGVTYALNHQPATNSLIPFVGPILQTRESWALVPAAHTGNPQVDGPANQNIAAVNSQIQTAAYAVLAVDCAVQIIGTSLTIAGVVGKAPTKYAAIEPTGTGVRVRF
jgi:hypothetical protein